MPLQPVNVTADTLFTEIEELEGYSFVENGGTNPITVTLRKGSVSGQVLFELYLAAGRSAFLSTPEPIDVEGGVYVQVAGTGTLGGVLFGWQGGMVTAPPSSPTDYYADIYYDGY